MTELVTVVADSENTQKVFHIYKHDLEESALRKDQNMSNHRLANQDNSDFSEWAL